MPDLLRIEQKNKHYLFLISCNIQTRMADDRFVFGVRVWSICEIIDAIDLFASFAMRCNSAINSGSSEILV